MEEIETIWIGNISPQTTRWDIWTVAITVLFRDHGSYFPFITHGALERSMKIGTRIVTVVAGGQNFDRQELINNFINNLVSLRDALGCLMVSPWYFSLKNSEHSELNSDIEMRLPVPLILSYPQVTDID